jgi:L-aminopeptidase/D-esterase-like protein
MKGLTDIAGIKVGHATDRQAFTGCTAILCESGAVAGADICGPASGTSEFETLSPLHLTDRVHAVVLAGGSAFGLETGCGVRTMLARRGVGFPTPAGPVPIVPTAIIYDLAVAGNKVRPGREMGESAAQAATDAAVEEGNVGAGAGATVGKAGGMSRAMKSGIGSASVALGGRQKGVIVAALAVVNAFGDIRDPVTGQLIAGARKSPTSREFIDTAALLKSGGGEAAFGRNTTLVVVATNARLTKVEATRLARNGSLGMARTLSPANTMFDGDLVVALSHGDLQADPNALGVAAAEAVAEAILRSVRMTPSSAGLPGLAGDRR